MNNVLRTAYFHISNGGVDIGVEEQEDTKQPVFFIKANSFGNMKTTFELETRKEYLYALGVMLIEAANSMEEPSGKYSTLGKLWWIKDGDGNVLSEPREELGKD